MKIWYNYPERSFKKLIKKTFIANLLVLGLLLSGCVFNERASKNIPAVQSSVAAETEETHRQVRRMARPDLLGPDSGRCRGHSPRLLQDTPLVDNGPAAGRQIRPLPRLEPYLWTFLNFWKNLK